LPVVIKKYKKRRRGEQMITNRQYTTKDYGKVMDFLREIYREKGNQYCWLPQRWDYAEIHCNPLYQDKGWEDWKKYIRLWEEDDQIVAIAHKETVDDVFLQVRPGYEFLGEELLDFLESTVPYQPKNEDNTLGLFINSSKRWIEPLLKARGYTKIEDCSYFNVSDLSGTYEPQLPDGYTFVDATEIKDQNKRAACCQLGFHPERESTPNKIYKPYMEQSDLFDPRLEIMTQDADGNLTSFSMIWYDPELKIGMVEPVSTRIDHRRQGLGKQMLIEGMRRLKAMGAKKLFVESYGEDRKAFYNSAGFKTFDADHIWEKSFK
jgi:hypothetical protein